MSVRLDETTPTRADAVQVGDHVRERRTGEVRRVEVIDLTLTTRRFILDDGTYFEAVFLDTVHVTREPITEVPAEAAFKEMGKSNG